MKLSATIIEKIISIAQNTVELSEQYQLVTEQYKQALVQEDMEPLKQVMEKHRLAVEAFALVDQQLQLLLQELSLKQLAQLSELINHSGHKQLIGMWEQLKQAITSNQQKNLELDTLLKNLEERNRQMLHILQGLSTPSSPSSYNHKGQIKSPVHGRILGTI